MSAREGGTQGSLTGNVTDALKGQVERRLGKLLDDLSRVRFVARDGQLVMDCEAHVVSLAFMVQRPGQFVTCEMPLAAKDHVAPAARAFWTNICRHGGCVGRS
jgi:hypothetical protein